MNDELFEKQIRDGMNAAFDAEDIKVTDELISKTMAAIMAAKGTKAAELNFDEAEKLQTETEAAETVEEKDCAKAADGTEEKDTRVVSFFRRPAFKALASIAAILVVAIVGITVVISNSRMGGMKSADHALMNGATYSESMTATMAKATMAPAMAETADACYEAEYYDEYELYDPEFSADETAEYYEAGNSMTADNGTAEEASGAAGASDYGFDRGESDEEDISKFAEAPMVSEAAEDVEIADCIGISGITFTAGTDGLCGISEADYALFSSRVHSDIVRVITDPDEIDAENAWDLGASALTIDGYVDEDGTGVYELISFYENIVCINRGSDGVNQEITYVEVEDIDALLTEAEELLYAAGSYSTGEVTE